MTGRALAAVALAACGGGATAPDADSTAPDADSTAPDADPTAPDARPHVPGNPGPGGHALAYYRLESHAETLSTPAMATATTGSTIVVSVGRGDVAAHAAPTDNRGNGAYAQVGTTHTYTNWPTSGTALYARADAAGGDGHVVTVPALDHDEVTLAAVEVIAGDGGVTTIGDVTWREVLAGAPLTASPVTTDGPATLVAFWWGDAGADGDKTAVPDQGFTVVDAILDEGSLVQCAVAVKEVEAAGTYTVTWTATPVQGAQLYLVAIE